MIELATLMFCLVFVAILIFVSLKSKESWPLSCYPMFSHPLQASDVVVFRLALETKEGKIIWWAPKFPRYQRRMGKVLKKLHLSSQHNDETTATVKRKKYRYLTDVVRLIAQEQGHIDNYQAFCIFRRQINMHSARQWVVEDDMIERIPMPLIMTGSDHV